MSENLTMEIRITFKSLALSIGEVNTELAESCFYRAYEYTGNQMSVAGPQASVTSSSVYGDH